MGEYVLNIPMIIIPVGSDDIVLGVQWLQSLRRMAFNFQKLYEIFMGRKRISVKWYHTKNNQGDKL